jgi:hypothetical protein
MVDKPHRNRETLAFHSSDYVSWPVTTFGGSRLLWNVSTLLQGHTASYSTGA